MTSLADGYSSTAVLGYGVMHSEVHDAAPSQLQQNRPFVHSCSPPSRRT